MRSKPETIANVSVKEYSFSKKQIQGVVKASQFRWTFIWSFHKGLLTINPPLGRALIEDALLRFLLKEFNSLIIYSSFLVFSCSRDSITLLYTLSNIDFSSKEIFPSTCEMVLKLFFPFIRRGDPIPILILLKFCVCNCSIMLLSPLCPP